ncbi:GGDEF domain-containing protein [Rhizobium sp. RCAM05350]|nr:GGDEF domain-containing protein [Rhizobium sp. RCAM05350]
MVCDIDHFKRINDNYGHAVGDKVIAALAQDLQRAFGGSGHVARVGGEEFIVFVPSVKLRDASTLANAVRISIGERNWAETGVIGGITVSIGLSEVIPEDHALEHAFLRADSALYKAKTGGRNAVAVLDARTTAIQPQNDAQPQQMQPGRLTA